MLLNPYTPPTSLLSITVCPGRPTQTLPESVAIVVLHIFKRIPLVTSSCLQEAAWGRNLEQHLAFDGSTSKLLMNGPNLNVIYWNIRGLNSSSRRTTVHEILSSTTCHIICL